MLAQLIVDGPSKVVRNALAGFAIGNPVMQCDTVQRLADSIQVDIYHGHNLIPTRLYMDWKAEGCDSDPSTASCRAQYKKIQDIVEPIDPDNLFGDDCHGNSTLALSPDSDCTSILDYRNDYLNRADFQTSIGAISTKWQSCVDEDKLDYKFSDESLIPYYNHLFEKAPELRILIFSGDADIGTVPTAFTQRCVYDLNRTIKKSWRAWKVGENPAGFVEVYDRFTFATVKGAGHEAPEFAPAAVYQLITRFLRGEKI
eukprot:Colp12_sorted_trinity150504_noHs@31728